ncbi:SMC5-SMC6 complex localization factor protein 1 [Tritrichomonas musculus]|uniref:SMC5-SMC6 complex localization factor protein 1 n=1 Tax=Tritrichomonas musculus TaxID=1915356 RepID=A0ABR2I806_9EUKA
MEFKHFWISPAFSSRINEFIDIILKINKDATQITNEGDLDTLHVGTIDEVISKFSSKLLYISDQCLLDINRRGLSDSNLLSPGKQYISFCLSNLCITSTGFSSGEIKEIAKKVILLGGKYQKLFQEDIKLVIAARTASQKVYSAISLHIPVVTVKWIDKCFANLVKVPLNQNQVLPFYGCKFTSTDLISKQNNRISEIVRKCGGEWSDKFDKSTTFLIAQTLSDTQKIKLALIENVPIVRPEWIFRSEDLNILEPKNFVLNWWCMGEEKSNLFQNISFGLSKDLPNRKMLIDIIIAHSGSYLERPDYFLTMNTKRDQANNKSTLVTPRWLFMSVLENRLIDPNDSPTFSPFPFSTKIQGVTGCSFFLSNLKEENRLEYADLLRMFGATVFFKFSKRANIIIAENTTDRLLSISKDYSIPIVNISWLIELSKTGILPDFDSHKPKENAISINFHQICQRIKKSANLCEGRSTNSTLATVQTQHKEIDFDELESYTQPTSGDKIKFHPKDIAYDADQENIEIQINNDVDPFLEALNQ